MSRLCSPADTIRGAALVALRWQKTLAVLCCEERVLSYTKWGVLRIECHLPVISAPKM